MTISEQGNTSTAKVTNHVTALSASLFQKILQIEDFSKYEIKEKFQCLPKEIPKKDSSQKICKHTKANKDDRPFLLPSNKLIITKHKRSSAESKKYYKPLKQ